MPDRAKILLVDDREENLIALEASLSSLDVDPYPVRSGEEALKALLTHDFALILLDVRMPGMDGFETAAHIKRRERTRNIPIIFLTGLDSAPDLTFRGYAAGAVDYLTKPFDPWMLRAKVSVFVELYNVNRRLAEQAQMLRERLSAELAGREQRELGSVLGELSDRLTAVEAELGKVRELAGTRADRSLTEALEALDGSVARLRAGLDALR
ncbi:response regulator [Thermobispora bispora]|uniref:Response regulator receiver protein n=1 Tax=Thermobispora bispora (strain ATCC 19993 / DSM 43833 / CBS 139.67 / JCM 10125 / KCTC 9307 / NBRC 14880 / R51) TaxID=469371 RepID=D6Y2V5_THEBD|nr:response regulator [Thermobispora bispora]ADG86916.1 response regulator receiver protein [Thermobispora bispora DSM 43833]MBO2475086.1 response regulator [Actinomycetales bacterium]QSI46903.1 response regulator [Thermobispora bispora]